MSANTVRAFLEKTLKPLLPRTWKWVSAQRNVDTLERVTVIWKQLKLSRLPAAPIGALRVEGVLTILSPHQDIERAETQLDDAVLELCTALDTLTGLGWTEARKVTDEDETFLGYDIDLFVTTAKTPEP